MSSSLRHQSIFEPINAHITAAAYPHSTSPPPSKKQRMTLTQTYRLAHRARGKLSSEASRGDHDLRLLVGHANLLDGLMLELQEAEREQEEWFEQTVSVAASRQSEDKKVQWSDQIIEEHNLEVPDASDDEESDDEDDVYAHVEDARSVRLPSASRQTRSRSPPPSNTAAIYDDDDEMAVDSDDENDELALVRTKSHTPSEEHDVPELVHDNSDDSDDDMSPESPPSDLSQQQIIVKDFASQSQKQKPMQVGNYFLPESQAAPMVAAY